MSSSTSELVDIEEAIASVRRKMRRSDFVTLSTVEIAENFAKFVRRQFDGHDLRVIAETLLVSSSCMGSIVAVEPNTSGMIALNVQAVAAVLVIDSLPPSAAVCPECAQGKHQNCTGQVLRSDDVWITCPCANRGHE